MILCYVLLCYVVWVGGDVVTNINKFQFCVVWRGVVWISVNTRWTLGGSHTLCFLSLGIVCLFIYSNNITNFYYNFELVTCIINRPSHSGNWPICDNFVPSTGKLLTSDAY